MNIISNPSSQQIEELTKLADVVKDLQYRNKTTSVTLDDLDEGRRTARETISVLLMGKQNGEPVFVFHNEPMQQPEGGNPDRSPSRIAVLGGGRLSELEKKIAAMYAPETEDVPLPNDLSVFLDERMKNPDKPNQVPPDLYYRMQGLHMLKTGRLMQLNYDNSPEGIRPLMDDFVDRRLNGEVGAEVSDLIQDPVHVGTMVTSVRNRKFGKFTRKIAYKWGMEENPESGELQGVGIEVHERFVSGRVEDVQEFVRRSTENVLVLTPNELIDIACRDAGISRASLQGAELPIGDLATWQARLEDPDGPTHIRNHSLMVGSYLALDEFTRPFVAKLRKWAACEGQPTVNLAM